MIKATKTSPHNKPEIEVGAESTVANIERQINKHINSNHTENDRKGEPYMA